MATLLAEAVDIGAAADFERTLPPGAYMVKLHLLNQISQEDLDGLYDHLAASGIDLIGDIVAEEKGFYEVSIKYRIHEPSEAIGQWQVALIGIIPAALIVGLIGIGFFKIEEISDAIVKIMLVGLGFTVIIVALVRKPLGVAAERYMTKKL